MRTDHYRRVERERMRAARAERSADGLCAHCGRHPAESGRRCESCREQRATSRLIRLCQSRCTRCGAEGIPVGKRECPTCRLRQRVHVRNSRERRPDHRVIVSNLKPWAWTKLTGEIVIS